MGVRECAKGLRGLPTVDRLLGLPAPIFQSTTLWLFMTSVSRRCCRWLSNTVFDLEPQHRFDFGDALPVAGGVLCRLRNRGHLPSSDGWMDRCWVWEFAAATTLSSTRKWSIINIHFYEYLERLHQSPTNFLLLDTLFCVFSVPARKVVLESGLCAAALVVVVVDSLSIYAINKQLRPIYNYAASIIEVVWRHSCHCCLPLTADQGQAVRQAVSNAVPSAWHPWQLSTEAVADQHSPLASLTFVASLLLSQALQLQLDDPHLCLCLCLRVCLDTCD